MNSKRNRTSQWVISIAALMLLGSSVGLAQTVRHRLGAGEEGERARGRGGEQRQERLFEFLEMTEEQQSQWTALHEGHQATVRPLFQQSRELQQELRQETESETANPTIIGELTLQVRDLRLQIREAGEALKSSIEEILTDEQQAKFEGLRAGSDRRFGPRTRGRMPRERGRG